MEYYVYVLLNPLKIGNYSYDEYCFEFEPFYVGKGKGKRIIDTLTENKNLFKKNVINKIKLNGDKPISIVVKDNLSEFDSFTLEKKLIKLIGRRNLNTGYLTNLTDGGEGTSGIIQSNETKHKRNESLKKYRPYFKSNEFKIKMKNIAQKRIVSDKYIEYCKNLSEKYKGVGNPMFGRTTSEKQKEAVKLAHIEGRNILSDAGRIKIIENGKKRLGKKNSIIKCDTKIYELTSPHNENFIIFGAIDLQKFCKDNKLQFHVLKNNVGVIDSKMVIGNKLYAKNTIGWKMMRKN